MLMVLLFTWLLLTLPVAVVVGRGIALGSAAAESAPPYPSADPSQVRQPDPAAPVRA